MALSGLFERGLCFHHCPRAGLQAAALLLQWAEEGEVAAVWGEQIGGGGALGWGQPWLLCSGGCAGVPQALLLSGNPYHIKLPNNHIRFCSLLGKLVVKVLMFVPADQ